MKDKIMVRVRDFFIASRDFNGVLLGNLASELKLSTKEFKARVSELVREGKMTLTFASHDVNPHIKRLRDLPMAEQLSHLEAEDLYRVCGYPSADAVKEGLDLSQYATRPFTQRLALAEPQLEPIYFDLDVLDKYYRDPRYDFDFQDFMGSISLKSEHYESSDVADRDRVFLQTFGIGYTPNKERVVVVYLRYLHGLSPEHQQVWNAHVAVGPCSMNSDYFRCSIIGDWAEYHSSYLAFLTEQAEINKLAALIGKPSLFKQDFVEDRPKGFGPMLRPTRRNFDEFVSILDKMLSENLNREFFKSDIPLENRVEREDGTFETQRPGTIQLLESWLRKVYRTSDGKDLSREILAPLRNVRTLRQSPAHALRADEFDRSLPGKQDELVGELCRTLTSLRLIFSSHPKARLSYTPPDWLDGDKIVFY